MAGTGETTCIYYTVNDIMDMLGISRGKAYSLLRSMNEDLENRGFIVIAGRIPKAYFREHYYGMAE